MNHTQYSVLCLKRICIYQLTLVLCTVSVAREPKSNVLVFIVGNTPPSEAWQRTGEFTVSFLGSDVSIIVLCVYMSSSLSTTAGYSTFIATLFTSYFMCQYIRLNPEKIFEELQACPKEVCLIYFFRLVSVCNKTLVKVCLMNLVVPVFTSPSDIKRRNSTMSYRSISYLTIQMVSTHYKVMFHWHCSEVFTLSMIVIRVAVVKRRDRVCLLDVVVTWFALCFVRFRFDRKYA